MKIPLLPILIEKSWSWNIDNAWRLIYMTKDNNNLSRHIYYNFKKLRFIRRQINPFMGSWLIGGVTKK